MKKRIYRVLLVNDSSTDNRLIREALIESGYNNITLDIAMDEAEAKNYLHRCSSKTSISGKPDFIILDLNLPGNDGMKILDFIKFKPDFDNIPIVVLTTSSNSADIRYCYEKKANCYITKPVDYESFVLAIKGICSFWLK